MPYKNPKDRKKQKNPPVGSKAHEARMERQRARRAMDKAGRDANKNGKADKREGKDVMLVRFANVSTSRISETAGNSKLFERASRSVDFEVVCLFRMLCVGFWNLDFGFWFMDLQFCILDFGFWVLDSEF